MTGVRTLLAVLSVLPVLACRDATAPAGKTNAGVAVQTPPNTVQLKVGDPAPPFSLSASDGKVYDLASFRGKQAVVLAWFVKAFSEP